MVNIIHLNTLLRRIITDRVIRPLYLFVSQMAGYINKFVSDDWRYTTFKKIQLNMEKKSKI